MLSVKWSLGLCSLLAVISAAATPAQLGATEVARLLDNRTAMFPTPMITNSSIANLSAISLSNRGPIQCFENYPTPVVRHYWPIMVDDYMKALVSIIVNDDAVSVLSWYFEPGQRRRWCFGGCCIGVGAPGSARTVSAQFQPAVVAHLAAKVAQECLKPGRDLGGFVSFGDYEELSVIVIGTLGLGLLDTAVS